LFAVGNILLAQRQEDPRELLRLCYVASGGEEWNRLAQVKIIGSLSLGGLSGTFTQVIDLQRGRDVQTFSAGPLSTLTDSSWEVDRTGLSTVHDGPEARADAIMQSFEDCNGWFYPEGSEVHGLASHEKGGKRYDLVSITPPGGRPLTLWLDTVTHLLERAVQQDTVLLPRPRNFSE
jgi:hypothetical protein